MASKLYIVFGIPCMNLKLRLSLRSRSKEDGIVCDTEGHPKSRASQLYANISHNKDVMLRIPQRRQPARRDLPFGCERPEYL